MTPNLKMEQLSLIYVRTVAASAGFQVVRPEIDRDSVDGIIISDSGTRPRLDFQAKSTTRAVLRGAEIHYTLPVKNYDDLRAITRTPRILVVLLMPTDQSEWVKQSEDELCMRYGAYWHCLEGQPATSNTSSVTVQIPTQNILSVNQLAYIMARVNRGESLC